MKAKIIKIYNVILCSFIGHKLKYITSCYHSNKEVFECERCGEIIKE